MDLASGIHCQIVSNAKLGSMIRQLCNAIDEQRFRQRIGTRARLFA